MRDKKFTAEKIAKRRLQCSTHTNVTLRPLEKAMMEWNTNTPADGDIPSTVSIIKRKTRKERGIKIISSDECYRRLASKCVSRWDVKEHKPTSQQSLYKPRSPRQSTSVQILQNSGAIETKRARRYKREIDSRLFLCAGKML